MYLIDFACDQARRRARLLPAGGVLLTVLVLLHGVEGTVVALARLAVEFAGSLLGGGDASVVGGVFWRTLPLALSAAAVTFAVRSGWLHLTHWHSYFAIALIIMAGAIVGNAVHEELYARQPIISVGQIDPPREGESLVSHALRTGNLIGGDDSKLRALGTPLETPPAEPGSSASPLMTLGDGTAIGIDTSVGEPKRLSWLAPPDLSLRPEPVQPLFEVEKGQGFAGLVLGVVSQLLGYLFAYQPRLFLASVLAGGYLGWRLQRRFTTVHALVTGDLSELSDGELRRLAA